MIKTQKALHHPPPPPPRSNAVQTSGLRSGESGKVKGGLSESSCQGSLSENGRKREKRGKGSHQSGEGTQGSLYSGQDGLPMLLADEAEAVSLISLQTLSCISTDCVICRHEELGLADTGTVSPA